MATMKEIEQGGGQGGGHSEDGGRIGGPFDDGNDSFGDAAEEAEVNRIAALTSLAMGELDLEDVTLKMLIAVGRIMGCTIKSNLKKKLALAILADHQEPSELAATEATPVVAPFILKQPPWAEGVALAGGGLRPRTWPLQPRPGSLSC